MTEIILTSSALILFLIAVRRLLRGRIHPSLQYALWLLVAARLLIPGTLFTAPVSLLGIADPLVTTIEDTLSPLPLPPISDAYIPAISETIPPSDIAVDGDTIITTYPPQATAPALPRSGNPIKIIWILGVLTVGSALLLSNITFYSKLRRSRRPIPLSELSYPCRINVYQVYNLVTPCLFGLVRPGIYLNTDTLSGEELEHILTHEETHYRHGDHLWSALRCLCLALHWYNPLVWWAAVLSRRDCELSCDNATIRRLGEENRIRYGETLLRMVVPGRHPADLLRTATTMSGSKKTMTERIRLIADRPKMLKITLALVVLAACIAAVVTFSGSPEETDDTIDTAPPAADSQTTLSENPAPSATVLSAEAAAELYHQAREIWDWFEHGTLPTTDAARETPEGTLLEVEQFNTLEQLRQKLEQHFSPELATHLLTDYTTFREIDGRLYFLLPLGRSSSEYAGKESVTAFPLTGVDAAQQGYDCHVYAATEVLDFYDTETVLYQKRHDWYMIWNGQNYVFTSFGPFDDVDPQRYYNVLTILDHYNRGNTITTWFPVLANLDWNALYASQHLWPEDFDLGIYIIESISQYITQHSAEMTGAQYNDILSATEGLDGAYSEGFGHEVYRLYENNPGLFAYTVLEDLSLNNRNRVLDLFRYEEVMRGIREVPLNREYIYNFLRNVLSATVAAAPTSMRFNHTGQQERFLPINTYGISTVSYSSSNPDVAAVDNEGLITAVSPGTATITLHYEGAAGQKDLTCTVTCEWEEKAEETEAPEAYDESELPSYADGEAINGYMRAYAPTVWDVGSPSDIETTLSDDWTMDGIRSALFQAVSAHLQRTLLEKDLVQIELSPQFQFPETMADGVVLHVPFYAHYARESITLPSGASYTPAMRGQETTAKITLVGSGITAPVDENFAKQQEDYQLLEACVPIPGGIQVSAAAEEFDITTYIRNTVIAALQNAGLSERYYLSSISTGSYTNPVWANPGYEQTVFYEVAFSSVDDTGISLVSMTGKVLVTTIE